MRSLFARLRDTFSRQRLDRELDTEIATHLALAAADMEGRGMNQEEARQTARKEFGGLAQIKEADREVRSLPLLESVWAVLRDAVRTLWKRPRFAAVAIFTLALGIGATTAVYSVVHGVLLKPLPFHDPDRVVALYHVTPASQKDIQGAATYFTYRDHGHVFEDIGLWTVANVATIRSGVPEQVRALRVTDGTLPLLGLRAEHGRLIGKDDDVPGAPPVTVLTNAYWQQAFNAAPDIIGQSLVIDGQPYEIIGILPASFEFLETRPLLVVPLRMDRATTRTGSLNYNGVARLKPDVTLARANDDIARMIPLVARQFLLMPGLTQATWDAVRLRPNVRPLSEAVVGDLNRPLWILLGVVGIVLLMSWTNVANLMLVRAEGRQRELAVRGALGASRGRIAAALLSESLVLGLAGSALGMLFAQAGIALLRRMAPVALPRLNDIVIDHVVLLVTLATSVVTSLLFGLVPVLRSRTFHADALREAGRSITDSRVRHRTRNTLVVAQIALALVLLIISGLMARTFVTMHQVQPGFVRPAELQAFDISLPAALIRDPQQLAPIYKQIDARLRQIPGVTAVGLGAIRMDGVSGKAPIYVKGGAVPNLAPIRSNLPIGAGYVETMGIAVLAGRAITWRDIDPFKPVALISETLAREYWDAPAKAVGQQIATFPSGPWREIVGVVGNVRADGLNHPAPALVYYPMADEQSVNRNITYVVRSDRAGTPGFLRELQQAVWSVNPNRPLANVRTVDEIQAGSMAQTSFAMVMLAIAAGVALLLAVVGTYGVVSHIAAERTNEVGIRMALGAQTGDVRRLFLRYGLTLTLTGIMVGLGAAVLLTPVMAALLYGVGPTDPITYLAVAVALAAVTLLATYLPARRASRVQPIIALRSRV